MLTPMGAETLPLMRVLDGFLTAAQQDRFSALCPRQTYVVKLKNYLRLLPETPGGWTSMLWDRLPPKIISKMRKGRADLLLDYTHESALLPGRDTRADLAAMYDLMARLKIPPNQIILATANAAAAEVHDRIARELGVPAPMRVWSSDFGLAFSLLATREEEEAGRSDPPWNPPAGGLKDGTLKHFLFLNRKVKPPRVAVLLTLAARVGLDKAYVSMLGDGRSKDREAFVHLLQRGRVEAAEYPDREAWDRAIDALMDRFPIALAEDVRHASVWDYSFRPLDRRYYGASAISLVSETLMGDRDSLVITEKTFKPIWNGHPFIVIGDVGTLEQLRRLGFRTFGPTIDEGYDGIADYRSRLEAIRREVERIGAFDQAQLADARRRMAEAVEHNHRHVRGEFRIRFTRTIMDDWERIARQGG